MIKTGFHLLTTLLTSFKYFLSKKVFCFDQNRNRVQNGVNFGSLFGRVGFIARIAVDDDLRDASHRPGRVRVVLLIVSGSTASPGVSGRVRRPHRRRLRVKRPQRRLRHGRFAAMRRPPRRRLPPQKRLHRVTLRLKRRRRNLDASNGSK